MIADNLFEDITNIFYSTTYPEIDRDLIQNQDVDVASNEDERLFTLRCRSHQERITFFERVSVPSTPFLKKHYQSLALDVGLNHTHGLVIFKAKCSRLLPQSLYENLQDRICLFSRAHLINW